MYKKLVVYCFILMNFQALALTQKEIVAAYMNDDHYKILFDNDHFDRELAVFKEKTYSGENLVVTVAGGQKYSLISDLFQSMLNSPEVPLIAPAIPSRIYHKELAYIEEQYPMTKRRELLAAMNCAAAGLEDNLYCGIQFWNKMSKGTLIDLTLNTVLMAPLVAADLVSGGSGTTARNTAKIAAKSARPILIASSAAIKATVTSALISPSLTLKVIKKLEKVKINPNQFSAMIKLLNSKAFKITKQLMISVAKIGIDGDLTKLDDDEQAEIKRWLKELNSEISNFKDECTLSDDICKYFESLSESEISTAANAAVGVGQEELAVVIAALDFKYASLMMEFVNVGIIDPLTDNEDTSIVTSLFNAIKAVGFKSAAEFIPIAGPVIAWIDAALKAKAEIQQNFIEEQSNFLLFDAAKIAKQEGVMRRYQLAVIEETIFRINNSVNQVIYQNLHPEKLFPQQNNFLNVRTAFDNDIYKLDDFNSLLFKNNTLKLQCKENQNSQDEITLNSINFYIGVYGCKQLIYGKQSNAKYRVSFDLNNNTVTNIPINSFEDVTGNNEFDPDVNYLLSQGVLDNRNANFIPQRNITRAEFYAMFVRAFYPHNNEDNIVDWSKINLKVLQQKQPNNILNEDLNADITAVEVAKIAVYGRNIDSTMGYFTELHFKNNCQIAEGINADLFKLVAHNYLIVAQIPATDYACPYLISNIMPINRGTAARLVANLMRGVE